MWLKLDAKVPIDWENDQAVPANAELQFGKNINNIGCRICGRDGGYRWR